MITRKQIREDVLNALTGLHRNVTAYDGVVPAKVPEYNNGQVKPYIVVWVGNGAGLRDMEHLAGLADVDSINTTVQTQLVGATDNDVHELVDLVQPALTNLKIGGHPLKPDYDTHTFAYPLVDTGVTPHRRFLPLTWVINTQ